MTNLRTLVAPLLLLLAACGDSSHARSPEEPIECALLRLENFVLRPDADCTIAARSLVRRRLPDLAFTPGLCFTTGEVRGEMLGEDGRTRRFTATGYSGISSNSVTGTTLAPIPGPLRDADGTTRALISFNAASTFDLSWDDGGGPVSAVVSRDTGWGELGAAPFPIFAAERLALVGATRTDGSDFPQITGEILAAGDEFGAGADATGSLCGPGLFGPGGGGGA